MEAHVMSRRFTRILIVAFAVASGSSFDATLDTPAAPEDRGGQKVTWLLGHAQTGRNRWVTGAAVLVTPASGESRIYVTTTDEKGSYFFDALPEGLYDVMITKSG